MSIINYLRVQHEDTIKTSLALEITSDELKIILFQALGTHMPYTCMVNILRMLTENQIGSFYQSLI